MTDEEDARSKTRRLFVAVPQWAFDELVEASGRTDVYGYGARKKRTPNEEAARLILQGLAEQRTADFHTARILQEAGLPLTHPERERMRRLLE